MCREHGVIRLNYWVSHLRSRVHAEFEFWFLAIVCGKTIEEKGTKAGACPSTESMEDEEPLQSRAIVSKTSDFISHSVDDLFPDCVMTSSIFKRVNIDQSKKVNFALTVASSILLSSDQSLGMEECPIGTRPNFIDDIRFKINVKRSGDVFSAAGLREESGEAAIVLRWRALSNPTIGLEIC
jgi:hypothetical protein